MCFVPNFTKHYTEYLRGCHLLTNKETKLILQIFYWIYEIAIHSRYFILDLPIKIDLCNQYYLFFLQGIGLFLVCFTVWENAGMTKNY
jgi:hypothetical protein